jgi:hypothetical protein
MAAFRVATTSEALPKNRRQQQSGTVSSNRTLQPEEFLKTRQPARDRLRDRKQLLSR